MQPTYASFSPSQGVEYVGSLLWDAFYVSRGYLRQTSLRRGFAAASASERVSRSF